MTREERERAIKEFREWRDSYYDKNKLPATMFIEEVIKILEQEPNGDLISREAFIDRYKEWNYSEYGHKTSDDALAIRVAKSLSSVNPQLCEEAISRQATIEAFQMFRGYEANRTNTEWVDRIETVVKKLPPVTPQSKVGHWIRTYGNVKCSVCGSVKDSREVGKATHYCDFCGAKMVEPQEGSDKE